MRLCRGSRDVDHHQIIMLAEEYSGVDIVGFLSEIVAWQQEHSTNDFTYTLLDTVIDIFTENLIV